MIFIDTSFFYKLPETYLSIFISKNPFFFTGGQIP